MAEIMTNYYVSVVVEIGIFRKSGGLVKHGLELYYFSTSHAKVQPLTRPLPSIRCLDAKSWEDRPTVLRQVEQVGEKSYVRHITVEHVINNLTVPISG
jgi:ATP-dependent DNA helicase HFM1/MER3